MATTENRKPAPFVPGPDRPPELPTEDVHRLVEESVAKLSAPRIANAGRNAFELLRKAWRLHPVDSNMSLFCAITAEEEAATAVIRALQHREYPLVDQLRVSNHAHKAALWPLIQALQDMAIDKNMAMPNMQLRTEGEPRVDFRVNVGDRGALDEPMWATPDEPFNFVLNTDYNGPFAVHNFAREFRAIAKAGRKGSIFEHIKAEGNLRNRILYASDEGIPGVEFADDAILTRRRRVTALIVVTIAIMQTSQHQHFLVQCLDVLVRIVAKYGGKPTQLPTIEPHRRRMVVADQPDGTRRVSLEYGFNRLGFSQSGAPDGHGGWRWSGPTLDDEAK
ncbi:hypothetical protein [Sphingobium yanoikuyae]|uniref:Uncharacterized protein n=1 Tax=Sphingobium yanoikuyae TaxID=13690 RepID=A0A9X7UDI3_SPHYA|nr:hypothetical protein [Sphingobium yanoikuyae]QNG45337.1 hypothetical protein H3V42_26630 [Sphingobium yanoikuyae]